MGGEEWQSKIVKQQIHNSAAIEFEEEMFIRKQEEQLRGARWTNSTEIAE